MCSWLGVAMEIRSRVYIYSFDGMLPDPLPGETTEEAMARMSWLQLTPIIKQLNTKVQSFNRVVQTLTNDSPVFPTFTEFQATNDASSSIPVLLVTTLPLDLFTSPPVATTTLVRK